MPKDQHMSREAGSTDAIIAEAETASLAKALRLLVRLVERRNTIPILGGIIISAHDSGVRLTGTDLDIEMSLDVAGSGVGAVVVPLRRLRTIIDALGDAEKVDLSSGEGEGRLSIRAAGMTARIATYPTIDFPLMDLDQKSRLGPPAVFPDGELASLLRFVRPVISTEETRYYLNGVHFSGPYAASHPAAGIPLAATATDGSALMMRAINMVAPPPPTLNAIVPRKAVEIVLAAIGDAECEVEFADLRARFRTEGVEVVTKLIDGTFPDVRRVIPAWCEDSVVEIASSGVRRIARAAAGFNGSGCLLKVGPRDGGIRLSAGWFSAHEFEVELDAEGAWRSDCPTPIGFKAAYLLPVIAACAGKTIEMCRKGPLDPWRFRPAGNPETRDVIVVMPLRG